MAILYPGALDGTAQFPQPAGTNLLSSLDHAALHTNVSQLGTLLEVMIGTTTGTNMLGLFLDGPGEFAPSVNSTGVFQDVMTGGTFNNFTLGTPAVTGGTYNNGVFGTPAATGGTYNNGVFGTATLQAPTINGQGTNSGTVSGGVYGTAQHTGGTVSNALISSPTIQTWDGWTNSADTWVYASASTFTIAGVDRTAVYTKGTRLKFTNSGTKYAVVVSSSFSTNTTVTIAVNTDFVIANAAITAPQYSYEASPAGYPGWFNYTPAFGGFSVDPTSPVCRFNIIGNICHIVINMDNNGTSNATNFTITAPVTSAGPALTLLTGGFGIDNNTGFTTNPIGFLPNASTTISLYKDSNEGSWTNSSGKRLQGLTGFYQI